VWKRFANRCVGGHVNLWHNPHATELRVCHERFHLSRRVDRAWAVGSGTRELRVERAAGGPAD
jgi:hypothetical protein